MGPGRRALAALIAFALASSAIADMADDERTKILKTARPALEGLAAWCGEQRLFRKRAGVAAALVTLDPDHEDARGWLHFKKNAHGDWVRALDAPTDVDSRRDDDPEWAARRAEVLDPLRRQLETVCDTPAFARTPGRDRTMRLLIALFPADKGLRAKHGERLVANRWVLDETAGLAEGRKRVDGWVAQSMHAAFADDPVVERKVAGDEAVWACSATLGSVFVATTGNATEASALAVRLVAARRLVDFAMGRPAATRGPVRCDLLLNQWENKRYIEKCIEQSAESKKDKAALSSWWRNDDRFVVCDEDAGWRTDDAVRQMISGQRSEQARVWQAPAWLSEGIGLYLTWKLVGTRRTYFVQATEYADQDFRREMAKPKADWLGLARGIVRKQGGSRIAVLAGTTLNGMTGEDDVMAFAVASYLVECRSESVAALFESAATSRSIESALTSSLGLDLESFDARFGRWLEETR